MHQPPNIFIQNGITPNNRGLNIVDMVNDSTPLNNTIQFYFCQLEKKSCIYFDTQVFFDYILFILHYAVKAEKQACNVRLPQNPETLYKNVKHKN